MKLLSRPRRPRRSGEWTDAKAVTFIVTLAATHCVTLAAREAGMSRKSAYALKDRDRAFAEAWCAALATPRGKRPKTSAKGDKTYEADRPRPAPAQGDKGHAAAASHRQAIDRRDEFFGGLARSLGRPPLAPHAPAQ